MDNEELMPQVHQAADMILDLIGQVAVLNTLLNEIPDDQIVHLLPRYVMMYGAVSNLPVKVVGAPDWAIQTKGDA